VWGLASEDLLFVHLALLAYGLDQAGLKALSKRLKLKREYEEDLLILLDLQGRLPELSRLDRASGITHLLEPYPARAMAVIWIASESDLVRKRLLQYQTDWRLVEPALTGEDLKGMGLKPGPLFGDILETVRDARLDGQVSTRQEEVALVQAMLASGERTDGEEGDREEEEDK
jgi:tRNA nucleotidyltransferase (CCA-adding enzyme)